MRWAQVFEWQLAFGNALRLEMPAMPTNGDVRRNGAVEEREQVGRLAAGLHDVWRCSHEYVSRQLRLTAGGDKERKAGKQLAREGRVFLHNAGLLPWAAFDDDGSLPKGWWREDAFLSALGACMVEPESTVDETLDPGGSSWAALGVAAATGVVNLQLRAARLVLRRTGMGF
jgi:hypothetical protein